MAETRSSHVRVYRVSPGRLQVLAHPDEPPHLQLAGAPRPALGST